MLDLLRKFRSMMNHFSEMEFLGIHIDWVFHLLVVAVLVFAASFFMRLRRAIQLAVAAILFKELFDIFAKTRVEYIRAPTLDILVDLTAGILGILLGVWVTRRFKGGKGRRL
jgi:hypothetical protein